MLINVVVVNKNNSIMEFIHIVIAFSPYQPNTEVGFSIVKLDT